MESRIKSIYVCRIEMNQTYLYEYENYSIIEEQNITVYYSLDD